MKKYQRKLRKLEKYLENKKKILFLTTSNRFGEEVPKSNELASYLQKRIGKTIEIIDVTKLVIYPCEGNVSSKKGNFCGIKSCELKNKNKNPSGNHRCWASLNNKDDELWKISKRIFESEVVLFFGSVRWGKMNSIYQKLIERLTWLENRHTTLKEDNLLKNKEAGMIVLGHNWNSRGVLEHERRVLGMFGFKTPRRLFLNWQYTSEINDESSESYKKAYRKFLEDFKLS